MLSEVTKNAFYDELEQIEKVSGSLQGHLRSGRRPMGVTKLLNREKDGIGKKLADIVKTSALSVGSAKGKGLGGYKAVALAGTGALALSHAQKMKRRYEMGRQMELQQSM